MKWIYVLFALVAGAVVPLQAGINARLRLTLGDAATAALVSFAVGTVALLGWFFAMGSGWPASAFSRGPWWMWTGGVLGAFFVAATIILAAELGAASMLAWILASQLMAGMLMDHYGLVGFAVREISPLRVLGAALLVAGAVLVQKF